MIAMNWDWVAGFVEGEGYIGWIEPKKTKPHQRQGRSARLVIGQADRRPLDAVRDFLLSQGCDCPKLLCRKCRPARTRPIWVLTVQKRASIRKVLLALRHKVIQKRDAVDYCLEKLDDIQAEADAEFNEAMRLRGQGLPWYKVAKHMHVHWARLKNIVTARGVPVLKESTQREIANRCQNKARADGLCIQCFKPREANGTRSRCRSCADKQNASQRLRRRKQNGQKMPPHNAPTWPSTGKT